MQGDGGPEPGAAGGLHNILVFGASFAWEDYSVETASLPRNPAGAALLLPLESIVNPTTIYSGPVNYTVTARSRGDSGNQAIYAFDTLEIGRHFELNAGIRYEWAEGVFRNFALPAYPPGTTPLVPGAVVFPPVTAVTRTRRR